MCFLLKMGIFQPAMLVYQRAFSSIPRFGGNRRAIFFMPARQCMPIVIHVAFDLYKSKTCGKTRLV